METKPFVRDTLFYMNIVGMNPENQTTFAKARAALIIVLGTVVTIFVLLDVVLNWTGVNSLLEGSDAFVAIAEQVIKATFLVVYSRRIKNLVESVQQFWPISNTGEEAKHEVQTIYNFVNKIRIGVKICYISTNFAFFIKPLVIRSKTLPISVYQPFDLLISPRYEIMYFLEYLNGILLVVVMLSFDFTIILFITHVVCELKMLKYEFANLKINPNVQGDEKECLKEIGRLVEHHSFVLRFIKELNNILSVFMLTEFVTSIFCICLGLFSLSGEGFPPTPTIAVKYALFIVSYVGELYTFCIGGNILAEESASVANAIYESGWWKTQPKLQKAVLLIMLRAQKAEKLTVGGMFDLDLNCFTNVVTTAFSFFTFMQAMQTKANEVLQQ